MDLELELRIHADHADGLGGLSETGECRPPQCCRVLIYVKVCQNVWDIITLSHRRQIGFLVPQQHKLQGIGLLGVSFQS